MSLTQPPLGGDETELLHSSDIPSYLKTWQAAAAPLFTFIPQEGSEAASCYRFFRMPFLKSHEAIAFFVGGCTCSTWIEVLVLCGGGGNRPQAPVHLTTQANSQPSPLPSRLSFPPPPAPPARSLLCREEAAYLRAPTAVAAAPRTVPVVTPLLPPKPLMSPVSPEQQWWRGRRAVRGGWGKGSISAVVPGQPANEGPHPIVQLECRVGRQVEDRLLFGQLREEGRREVSQKT